MAIGHGSGNVKMCKVMAPAAGTLPELLAAAQTSSSPAGCVGSFELDGGAVGAINGIAPENDDQAWLLRLDRGPEAVVGEQPIGFGDVVSLRLGVDPSTKQGPAGPAGPAGETGPKGPKGDRGPEGSAASYSAETGRGSMPSSARAFWASLTVALRRPAGSSIGSS